MNKRDQYKRLFRFFNSAFIITLQTVIYAYVWYHFYADSEELLRIVFFRRGNYVVIGMYALMIFFFNRLYGTFRLGSQRLFDALLTQIASVLCVNAVTYLQLCLIGRWGFMTNAAPLAGMTAVILVLMIAWVFLSRWIYARMFPPRCLLLVTGRYSSDALIRKFASRKDKYAIDEIISYHERLEVIEERILQYPAVVLADIPAETRNNLLKFCFAHNIRCYVVPKISDIMIMSAESIHLFDTSLLLLRNSGPSVGQQLFKRLWDVLLSVLAIIVSSPLMLAIALSIRLYDHGPVLFAQQRLTKDGRKFKILKFRSMRVAPVNESYCLTRKNDDRVTPIGRWIRAWHFDELPQLFNILRGDMSFVGPRPETPRLTEEYSELIPEFGFRLKMKAGLTGYAQVYGKYNTTPYDKLKLDMTYIEHYSLFLDFKLLLLTVKVLFQREKTEGIEATQTTAAPSEDLERAGRR